MFEVNLPLIKSERLKRGYTLQDMAEKMNLYNKSAYFKRENGDYKFKPEEIPQVAAILNIPLEKFFTQEVYKIEIKKKEGATE